jgi:hypothetical protein
MLFDRVRALSETIATPHGPVRTVIGPPLLPWWRPDHFTQKYVVA